MRGVPWQTCVELQKVSEQLCVELYNLDRTCKFCVQFGTKLVVPSVVVLLACDRVSGQHQQGPFPLLRATPDIVICMPLTHAQHAAADICMRIAATLARNGAVAC